MVRILTLIILVSTFSSYSYGQYTDSPEKIAELMDKMRKAMDKLLSQMQKEAKSAKPMVAHSKRAGKSPSRICRLRPSITCGAHYKANE